MPSYEIIAPLRSVMRIEIESEKELNRSEVYAAVTREDLDVFTETDWDDVTTSWDQSTEEELIIYEEDSAKELTRDDGKNIFRKATEKHLKKVISENVLTEDKDMVEDLVLAAMKNAIENAEKIAEEKMKSATGGSMPNLNIPGL